ncbi:hypothetical protein VTK73DRAFT_4143 [Phialemonium thermophilum]|uniref:Helicase ATP-binding domain-containing protein n=1 Tax=Phialemonium thermophilum TaxID=223376 RepID=A0ABR3VB26_9PEZI
MENVHLVRRILVKFAGLGYDAVVWDAPPPGPYDDDYDEAGGHADLYAAFLSAYEEYLNGIYFEDVPAPVMKARIDEFRALSFVKDVQDRTQPDFLRPEAGRLRGFQLDGLNWLLYKFHNEQNAILADDMGMGKTIQVVAALASLVLRAPRVWPFLLVVPNATCANWRRELKKWAPDLRVVAYYGGKEAQNLAYDYELYPNRSQKMKAHVVVMSYESAQDATDTFMAGVRWRGLVVDEGQRLKNDGNLLYKALDKLRVPYRVLLTGTPLQNNKRELFNLIQFVDRTRDAARLDETYQVLTEANIASLHELIRPYFLRRTKADILVELPPMARVIVPVSMTVLQERLYKSILTKSRDVIGMLLARDPTRRRERSKGLNNILMELRKCLCHPFLYSDAVEDRTDDPAASHANLVEASAKLMLLSVMLPKLRAGGHRVLLASACPTCAWTGA